MRKTIYHKTLFLALGVLCLSPRSAEAKIVGTMFSGPATADPMVVYWNPAAMTLLRGSSAMFFGGVTAINIDYDQTAPSAFDGSRYPTAELFVPRPELGFGAVTDGGLSSFRFGIGVAIPILDGATWDLSYGGKPASSRYFAIAGRQVHILVRPAVAYRFNRYVSVGLGFDIYPVMIRQDLMIDFGAKVNQLACRVNEATCLLDAPLARENPDFDGRSVIDGAGVAFGISGGVLIAPTSWLRIGLSIHSGGGEVDVPVDLEVELPETIREFVASNLPSVKLPELTATGNVKLSVAPLTIIAGVMVQPTPRLEIEALFHWTYKSRLSVLMGDIKESSSTLIGDQVLIRTFTDDWLFGVGCAYRLRPSLRVGLRASLDPSARTEQLLSPISVDFDKVQLELGLAWEATPWLTIYAEYAHFIFVPITVDESLFAPNANPSTPEEQGIDRPSPLGSYDGQANRLAAGVLVSF